MNPTRVRLSLLDLATVTILIIAAVILVGPGSTLYASSREWLSSRRLNRAVATEWPSIQTAAQRLYHGDALPDVVVFSDYQCPFCRAVHPAIDSALQAGARIGIIQMPLKIHDAAQPASRAALCAWKAGSFREVDRWLMKSTAWYEDTLLLRLPETLGVANRGRYERCMNSGEAAELLRLNQLIVDRLGLAGTPTFTTEEGVVSGSQSASSLTHLRPSR